jgi:probable blue pigment (indigoidine) exporter
MIRATWSVPAFVGVVLLLAADAGAIEPVGIAGSVVALLLSSLGYILAKRWRTEPPCSP